MEVIIFNSIIGGSRHNGAKLLVYAILDNLLKQISSKIREFSEVVACCRFGTPGSVYSIMDCCRILRTKYRQLRMIRESIFWWSDNSSWKISKV